MHVLNFLQFFQQKSLLDNINLGISLELEPNLCSALDQILPLLSSINSVKIDFKKHWEHFASYQTFNDANKNNKYSRTMNMLMTMPRILEFTRFGRTNH